jgi:cobalamin-dependent methionine synthase I
MQGKAIVNSDFAEGGRPVPAHATIVKRHGAAVVVMAFDRLPPLRREGALHIRFPS